MTDVLNSFVPSAGSDGLQSVETGWTFESEYDDESAGRPDAKSFLDWEIASELE
jgi:hypothetical protein